MVSRNYSNFYEYQDAMEELANYKDVGSNVAYPTTCIKECSHDLIVMVNKVYKDQNGEIKFEDRRDIGKKIGDVLQHCALLCSELRLQLQDVAYGNVIRLKHKKQ